MEWRWDGQEHNITIFHGRRIFGDKIWDGLHAFVGALKVACHTASFFHGLVPPFCFIRIQRNSSDFVASAKQARHHLRGIATTTPEGSGFTHKKDQNLKKTYFNSRFLLFSYWGSDTITEAMLRKRCERRCLRACRDFVVFASSLCFFEPDGNSVDKFWQDLQNVLKKMFKFIYFLSTKNHSFKRKHRASWQGMHRSNKIEFNKINQLKETAHLWQWRNSAKSHTLSRC